MADLKSMKSLIALISILLSISNLQAQYNPTGSISGQLLDEVAFEPIPFANVIIKALLKVRQQISTVIF